MKQFTMKPNTSEVLWLPGKSHSSSNRTAVCFSRISGQRGLDSPMTSPVITTLTYFCQVLRKRRRLSGTSHELLSRRAVFLWSGWVIASDQNCLCQSVCRAVDVLLPQVRQAAMKQTLCAVCFGNQVWLADKMAFVSFIKPHLLGQSCEESQQGEVLIFMVIV